MIKLIVGLGNPGPQYQRTRHNAGFWLLQELAEIHAVRWISESRFHGQCAMATMAGHSVRLLTPDTFMNRSGLAVSRLAGYFRIDVDQILVVHDELDFAAGVIKVKKDGGHAGHNGLKDIIAHLGSRDFYRLRIGIGRPAPPQSVVDYVLSAPPKDDREKIGQAISAACSHMDLLIDGQLARFAEALR